MTLRGTRLRWLPPTTSTDYLLLRRTRLNWLTSTTLTTSRFLLRKTRLTQIMGSMRIFVECRVVVHRFPIVQGLHASLTQVIKVHECTTTTARCFISSTWHCDDNCNNIVTLWLNARRENKMKHLYVTSHESRDNRGAAMRKKSEMTRGLEAVATGPGNTMPKKPYPAFGNRNIRKWHGCFKKSNTDNGRE
jgi:hypothetical protein